jgi:hypothetical protein
VVPHSSKGAKDGAASVVVIQATERVGQPAVVSGMAGPDHPRMGLVRGTPFEDRKVWGSLRWSDPKCGPARPKRIEFPFHMSA